jgi:transcriptional regulator with XRE-family HTH domain
MSMTKSNRLAPHERCNERSAQEFYLSSPNRLRKEMGQRLRRARLGLGLSVGEVAARCGYRNLSKGARKVAAWERGEPEAMLDASRYFTVVGLDADGLQVELMHITSVASRLDHLGDAVIAADRALFCEHIRLFLDRADLVQSRAELRNVLSPAASFRILWRGGGIATLGGLIAAWSQGGLQAEVEGKRVYLFAGSGSQLSGSGSSLGASICGAMQTAPGSPSKYIRSAVPWTRREPVSGYSLADVVVALGGTAPSTVLRRVDVSANPRSDVFGTYDPNVRMFQLSGGDAYVLASGEEWAGLARTAESFGSVAVGGRHKAPLRLGPDLSLGAFETGALQASGYAFVDGRLQRDDGYVPLQIDGPSLPSSLLPVIATELASPPAS